MSLHEADKFAAVVPAPEASEVYTFATAATSQRYNIPDSWQGGYVRFVVKGEAIQVLFGGATVSVTFDQAASVSTEDMTASAASGVEIAAGTYMDFFLPKDKHTDFAVVASGTTGFWQAYRASI